MQGESHFIGNIDYTIKSSFPLISDQSFNVIFFCLVSIVRVIIKVHCLYDIFCAVHMHEVSENILLIIAYINYLGDCYSVSF